MSTPAWGAGHPVVRATPYPLWHGPSTTPDVGLVRPLLALTALAAVVAMVVWHRVLRHAEACVSALAARHGGIGDARCSGHSVIFESHGVLTGYAITLGCTVAFLTVPFFMATAGLLVIRRVSVLRSVLCLVTAVTIVLAFNQLRLLAIATGIHLWGVEVGYARTHILIGTVISTVGVVSAGVAYLQLLLLGPAAPARHRRG